MPDTAAPAESLWQRVVRIVVGAAEDFFADDVPRMAAAMSYFLLLALAPLILLANVLFEAFGLTVAQSTAAPNLGAASAAAASGYQQATAWAGSYAPWLIGVLVLVGALSVFGQFVDGVNRIWKTPPKRTPMKDFLRQRGMALALMGVAAAAFVVAIVVTVVVGIVLAIGLDYAQSLGVPIPAWAVSGVARSVVVYVASALLFAVGFVLAPDRRVRWLDALPGALLTAVAFLVGEIVLSIYLGSTQRFVVFGASQFFVVLTVWIYYSALVVFGGVELTRMMVLDAETRRGDPPQPVDGDPGVEPADVAAAEPAAVEPADVAVEPATAESAQGR
jgi:membrane protein